MYIPSLGLFFSTTSNSAVYAGSSKRNSMPFGRFQNRHLNLNSRLRGLKWSYSRFHVYNFLAKNKWLSTDLTSNYLISQQDPRFVKFNFMGRDGRFTLSDEKAKMPRAARANYLREDEMTVYRDQIYTVFHEYPKKILSFYWVI
jgi:hypothetical protein